MATIKSYTDIEQSKKLAEILPSESADMSWCNSSAKGVNYTDEYSAKLYTVKEMQEAFDEVFVGWDKHWKLIPCWSLAALLNVLPKIHGLKPILDLEENSIQYSGIDLYITASNIIDACVETILKLYELKKI